ncbi:MAG: hypothetical protein COB53_01140 [Elusimicrobia bacterium]|nr:MAG: hypothetical protein COB53_01140 [Elusimicrobiota bacterium]
MKENFQITIKRPVEEVFTIVNDFEQLSKASEGKISIKPVDGKPSTGKGAEQVVSTQFPGMDEIRIETVEFDENKRVLRKFHIKDLPTTVDLKFSPKDGETVVDLEVELIPQSMVYKMMIPMLAKTIKDQKGKAMEEVQKQLESQV